MLVQDHSTVSRRSIAGVCRSSIFRNESFNARYHFFAQNVGAVLYLTVERPSISHGDDVVVRLLQRSRISSVPSPERQIG